MQRTTGSRSDGLRLIKALLCALLVFAIVGCAKTRLTRVQDPEFVGKSFSMPAVYAAINDMQQRQLVEESMVSELERKRVRALATIHLFPPTKSYTPEERREALASHGVDCLIVIASEWGTTEEYVPVSSSTTRTTGSAQISGNQATFESQSRTQYHGGYYVDKPWAKADFAVVDLASGRMAWLGTSETKGNAFATFDTIRESYAKVVTKRMMADQLLTEMNVSQRHAESSPVPTRPSSNDVQAQTPPPNAGSSSSQQAISPRWPTLDLRK